MDIYCAKEKIEASLISIEDKLRALGFMTKREFYYEDSEFEKLDFPPKKDGYINGDLTVYTDFIPEDEGLILGAFADIRSGEIDDEVLDNEIREFEEESLELIAKLEASINPEECLREHLEQTKKEAEIAIKEFEKQIKKSSKIAYVAGGVAILIILAIALVYALLG